MTQRTVVGSFYRFLTLVSICLACISTQAQNADNNYVRNNFVKREVYIPMRDGVRLFTVIYVPKDSSAPNPFLIERTPYSAGPYGTAYSRLLGPNESLMKSKYIFVYQDVRGRYMSEGNFREVTPHDPTRKGPDESTDSYDTIEWLLANIKNNNGRVGLYGISYPGFYVSASLPSAHPAIKAVSPQAPITDEFIGDDVNHKGAFFLMDNFSFSNYFDAPRKGPVEDYEGSVYKAQFKDAYKFFLNLGPLKNTLKPEYFGNTNGIFKEYLQHDTYDEYWRSRNIRTHLKNIKPAVLVTGGWFDAEDLFGALETYEAIEKQNSKNSNRLVMGPWTHGAWARGNWSQYTTHQFGQNTSKYFQDSVETPFFNYYLKDSGNMTIPEAVVFETGSNTWKKYAQWPPAEAVTRLFYLGADGGLTNNEPANPNAFREYLSDPAKPVPYTSVISPRRNNDYMAEDQRFASQRPDVLVFETDTLKEDLTISGNIIADLYVSTTGTDADFIVKLIDVLPDNEPAPSPNPQMINMGGMQRLVRAEVMRGKFRNSFEKPEAFVPGKISRVRFELPDAAHRFKKGHRIMIQVQSSWFPLVDRNPQKFMRIVEAEAKDYQKATIRIYGNSRIELPYIATGY